MNISYLTETAIMWCYGMPASTGDAYGRIDSKTKRMNSFMLG